MTKVLVVYGSRHGGTQGIAERIGEVLQADGLRVEVADANHGLDLPAKHADAVVVGSGVYMGSWLSQPLDFLQRNVAALATRPLWLFSSGPLDGSTAASAGDPVADALGPVDGPGSGGRKRIEELSTATHPRDHRVFHGKFDPSDPPKALSERLVRMMPMSKGLLPPGDFRDWEAIDTWAHEIAASLTTAGVAD